MQAEPALSEASAARLMFVEPRWMPGSGARLMEPRWMLEIHRLRLLMAA